MAFHKCYLSYIQNMVNKRCFQQNGTFSSRFILLQTSTLVEDGMGSHSTRNAYLMLFCLCYVNFISFPSLSHKPLLMRYSVNNKCLKNETYSLLSFCVCYMFAVRAHFQPHFIVPERTETCLSSLAVFLCYVNCEKSQIL